MTEQAKAIYQRLLLLRCQAGDEAAFSEIVCEYSPRLRLFLRKLIGEGAEDALQDVWLSAWRGFARLDDPAAFAAWIYRIARDRAYAGLRKRGRMGRPLLEDDLVCDEDEPEFSLEDVARIHAALDLVGPGHREVLLLRFIESMNYEQIANVVGCAVGTVRSRLHYAKKALRDQIERIENHERERTGKGAASI